MDINKINNVIANAQRLMSPQGQIMIENRERSNTGKKPKTVTQTYQQPAYQPQPQPQQYQAIGNMRYQESSNSNFQFSDPKLRESFEKMPPIELEPLNVYGNTFQPGQELLNEQQKTMSVQQYQQPIYPQQTIGVDYNYLKTIINECVRENLTSIKQNLQENQLKAVRISGGNKIQLLDNKGNLYEGVLTMKKKAK